MNLVLFDPEEIGRPLPRDDRRAIHVLQILRRSEGDTFDAGIVNGPRGKATVTAITDDAITFAFAPAVPALAPSPIILIVGLPRPQTARDILRDATTFGVGAIHFVATEKAERSYAQSSLWNSGEWRRHVTFGAEQAFDTRIPNITHGKALTEVLATLRDEGDSSGSNANRAVRHPPTLLALDNYEAAGHLATATIEPTAPVIIAIGSERGWSAAERDAFRAAGFRSVHLGARVLRTETAVIAALTLIQAKLEHR